MNKLIELQLNTPKEDDLVTYSLRGQYYLHFILIVVTLLISFTFGFGFIMSIVFHCFRYIGVIIELSLQHRILI